MVEKTYTTHHLKCNVKSFGSVQSKIKSYTIRKNDRDFQIGDILFFEEYEEDNDRKTGAAFESGPITHIQEGGKYGIEEGYVGLTWETGKTFPELIRERNGLLELVKDLQLQIQQLRKAAETPSV